MLVILCVPATISAGARMALPVLLAATVGAAVVDLAILRMLKHRWVFPDGAVLTGLIVGMVLSPHEQWYVAALTAVAGVVAKYVARIRTANVFNPAALGLVVTFYPFHTGQSWWGALPEAPPAAMLLLFAAGLFMTYKVNKAPAVLAFLGVYFLLFTITAYVGNPGRVVAIYRAPDLHAALYFAFFMLTDPPTSPPKQRDQLMFGALVGCASYAAFQTIGAAYFLLAGLLVGNIWEAWRRWNARRLPALSSGKQSPQVVV
jgi:Na+-translocating ferredoxin:NAD+ oxidoreductase RnfD subunit